MFYFKLGCLKFFFYMAEFSVFLENTISFYSVAEGIHQ